MDVPFAYSCNGVEFVERDMEAGTEKPIPLDDFPGPEELWRRFIAAKKISVDEEKIILEPYHYEQGARTPRYYQRAAINKTIEAVARGQKRILLAMATGTGKTYTAFQIAWRLWKSGARKKILYLADRNIVVDQAIKQDFKPFGNAVHKIQERTPNPAYEIYFSLYHQLAGEEGDEPFRAFKPEFFDLVIIDECHRGSAKEESAWRKILDYFSQATHIGMTATPKETRDVSSHLYFGDPIYVYTLKQGIQDGFLAPYKVHRVNLDRDIDGWRPEDGKLDKFGAPVKDKQYRLAEFDRTLVIDERTEKVAEKITAFLKNYDRMAKTIVFCEDTEHALRLRQALINLNQDKTRENPRYIVRITHDEATKERDLANFIDAKSKYPVIATTSELMSTGVDCKTCKLIVIDKNISSDIEFKQIVGRGTRLRWEDDKKFFTIMDFRGATAMFAQDDFWIIPDPDENFGKDKNGGAKAEREKDGPRGEKIYVDGVAVKIVNERVMYLGPDGKLITENVIDYSRKNILGQYATLGDFLAKWNGETKKSVILDELRERGVFLDELRARAGNTELDDFDLLCHIAYDQKPLTRPERARKAKQAKIFDKYQGLAREVIDALLDKYAEFGPRELENIRALNVEPFLSMGGLAKIGKAFGGRDNLAKALVEVQREIYAA